MATQQMYVDMASLQQLKSELEAALTKFTASFNELKSGINKLTAENGGFKGEGSVAFVKSFEGNPKTALDEVEKETRRTIDYMEQKIVSFAKTLGAIDDIASSNR